MTTLKIAWRVIRLLALSAFIVLAALAWIFTLGVYVFSGNKGSGTAQAKDLHMIRSTQKTIKSAFRKISN